MAKFIALRANSRLKTDKSRKTVAETIEDAASVICRLWKKFQRTGNVYRLGQDRRASTTSQDNRY